MATRLVHFADADLTVIALVTARQRLVVVSHVGPVRQVLTVGDGKHHHADAREDLAVVI